MPLRRIPRYRDVPIGRPLSRVAPGVAAPVNPATFRRMMEYLYERETTDAKRPGGKANV